MSLRFYEDILSARRRESSNFLWASRRLKPQKAWPRDYETTPQYHKEAVLQSPKINDLLTALSARRNVDYKVLEAQVKEILDEIGYDKKIKVLRWLGLVLVKICLRTLSGLYVNTRGIQELKSCMGICPVIFVPSHRSYADFILMSFICFSEDLAVPAIAAGMDFHRMWGMGRVLRNTGAFFIRRSYNDDVIYWTTFKQYINNLVTKGDLPIEFFIEGTRSRSNKSLPPKYGLILMILRAYFVGQVPDILFVPINISYDRILEEKLFAYEHLGIPKPKESTSGFFKSLSVVREKYGKIHVDFAEPISARDLIDPDIRTNHSLGPVHKQEISEQERKLIPRLSYEIIAKQQRHCTVNAFNVIAMILNDRLINGAQSVPFDGLLQQMSWCKELLERLGAYVDISDFSQSAKEALDVHRNLIGLDENNHVVLVQHERFDNVNETKLNADTITNSLPFIMLQIYTNPVLHYFTDLCMVNIILKHHSCNSSPDVLYDNFVFLKSLFSQEFVSFQEKWKEEFENAITKGLELKILSKTNETIFLLEENKKLLDFLYSLMNCFVYAYGSTCSILKSFVEGPLEEKLLKSSIQKRIEEYVKKENEFVHSYCLSMEMITNCLTSLVQLQVLKKSLTPNNVNYTVNMDKLVELECRLESYLPPQMAFYTKSDVRLCLKNKL